MAARGGRKTVSQNMENVNENRGTNLSDRCKTENMYSDDERSV